MIAIIEKVYQFLWGDWIVLPLPGGSSFRLSLLVLILIPAGIWFTIRTRFLPIRLFPDMLHTLFEKKGKAEGESHNSTLSALQTLIVSTATRVGMGNLVGVVAAISAGGAGAVFWMWVTALIGSSTAFVEATLAQIYKEKDPVYGGYRGGPAYYMHRFIQEKRGGKKKRYVGISVLFAISGLICWCGISQVISNSVTSAFHNAFHIPPIYTTVVLVALAAVIIFRKTATVKVLDVLVPVMAGCYFLITVILICMNFSALPGVFSRIFEEAFGIRQAVAGGLGTVVMNGVKRGLFSNEAGSGSAPCAAAAAESDQPVKLGLTQALGVFIDTIVICSCTAMIMLLTPESLTEGAQRGLPPLRPWIYKKQRSPIWEGAAHIVWKGILRLLGDLGQLGEGGGVVDSHLRQHLPVDLDAGDLQAVHEGGVVHAVHLAGGGDAGDPQAAEISLLELAAGVSVGQGLHHGLVGHLEVAGFVAPVALRELQSLVSSFARHHRALNTCHISKPP